MAEWRVQLTGDEFDLRELSKALSDNDPTIIEESGQYYLKAQEFDSLQEPNEVHDRAVKLINVIDSSAYLHFRDTCPILADRIVKIDAEGKRQGYVFGESHLTARGRPTATGTVISTAGAEISPDQPHPVKSIYLTAVSNKDVADALRYFRKGNWINLYKAYEIVRDDFNGEKWLLQQRWITKEAIKRFCQTAQSSEALGDSARHASKKYVPPSKPMSLHEATAVIGDLAEMDRFQTFKQELIQNG